MDDCDKWITPLVLIKSVLLHRFFWVRNCLWWNRFREVQVHSVRSDTFGRELAALPNETKLADWTYCENATGRKNGARNYETWGRIFSRGNWMDWVRMIWRRFALFDSGSIREGHACHSYRVWVGVQSMEYGSLTLSWRWEIAFCPTFPYTCLV